MLMTSDNNETPDRPSMLSEAPSASGGYAMNSSRLLLGLLQLSRQEQDTPLPEDLALERVISSRTLRVLLTGLHYRDPRTVQHSRRVAQLAVGIAQFLGWDGRHLKLMEIAGLLHDIGKIGVPDSILFKPGPLGPDEAALMSLHHNLSVDLLQTCDVDWEVVRIVAQSRDSFGSSTGLYRKPGAPIHMGARILAVADAYDALRTTQVYRDGSSHQEAMQVLKEHSGKQFDGNVVSALARWTHDSAEPLASQQEDDLATATGALCPDSPQEEQEAASLCPILSYLYLLESLYDGFVVLDADLRFRLWNAGAERMLGHVAEDLLHKEWSSQLLAYADPREVPLKDEEIPLRESLATGRPVTRQVKIRTDAGSWVAIETHVVPLFDDMGQLQGVAEIYRDVSRSSRRPQEYHALRQAATRDALTGVCNRGELETQLAVLVSEIAKNPAGDPFSVIFADVDHFKSVNDTFGHGVGDKVLIDFAKLLQHETYSGEIVGRYGGEEFVILCPATDIAQAFKRADRIRLAISQLKIEGLRGRVVTSSFGVTQAGTGDSIDSVLRRADEALYRAKHEGRNKVCMQTLADSVHEQRNKPGGPAARTLVMEDSFRAVIAEDMIIYKLGGFVTGEQGLLLEVTANRVLIRVGRLNWFRWWGSSDERQPVDVEISFGETSRGREVRPKKRGGPQVEVLVRIRPYGRTPDRQVFEARARRVFKKLASYFAAEVEV